METKIIEIITAFLVVPGVVSLIVAGLRKIEALAGVNPRVIVYAVSLVLTGIIIALEPPALPTCTAADPTACVTAWLTLTVAYGEMARRLYELMQGKVES